MNVKDYSMDSLMKNFSFVFQSVYLFQDTIANNIRFGQPDAPMDKVIDAAKKACCHDFIMSLPDGYETIIGEGGANLSGGEKQRLKLAVELNRTGTLYLLDEPTAGLHLQDVKKLIQLFDELVADGNSLIIVEHNLEVISQADWLIDMGPDAGIYGGQVRYTGTPENGMTVKQSRTGQAMKQYNQAPERQQNNRH